MARRFPLLLLSASLLVLSLFPLGFSAWMLWAPLDPHEGTASRICFSFLLALCAVLGAGSAYQWRLRKKNSPSPRSIIAWALIALLIAGGIVIAHAYRWEIRLAGVPRAAALPINTDGYAIEKLPFPFAVS